MLEPQTSQPQPAARRKRLLLTQDQQWVLQSVLRHYLDTVERDVQTRDYRIVAAQMLEELR